jgi:hypothetical protein
VQLCQLGLSPHRLHTPRTRERPGWGGRAGYGRSYDMRRLLQSLPEGEVGELWGGMALARHGRVVRQGKEGPNRTTRSLSSVLLHRRDEAVTPAMDRLNEPLLPPLIADSPARRHQPAGQAGLTDEPAGPQLFEEFFLGYDPVAVLNEIDQHIEHLRFELNPLAGAM